ncbi:MAG: hypothetical protein JW703_04995 [Candidatus Diapherotrites archaeon]|nr:hypothetical protein [Candidatus Diapherotrites archaeon]
MKGKLLILIILIAVALVYFNVIPLNVSLTPSDKVMELEKKYDLEEGFLPVPELIQDYIDELTVLKSEMTSNSKEKKFIEFKILSAKGFFYLNEAKKKIERTSPFTPDCTKTGAIMQAKDYLEESRNEFLEARKKVNETEMIKEKESIDSSLQAFINLSYELEKQTNKLC